MNKEHEVWTCTECGYTSTNRFIKDICPRCGMTYWWCSECGFTFIASAPPPDLCPECSVPCDFVNITCYIPGWREVETINPNLLMSESLTLKHAKKNAILENSLI